LAARPALLIAPLLLALGGCLKDRRAADAQPVCGNCHAPHYVQEGGCADCHRGDPRADRAELAHARLLTGRAAEHRVPDGPAVREGRRLVEDLACRRCHTVGGTGNRLATDLDQVAWSREQRQLTASILEPVENMPAFGLGREQAEAVIAYLLSRGRPAAPRDVYRVHFERAAPVSPSVFEEQCGGCHRFLGPAGALGRGNAGPNLSGLFTSFYPPTAPGEHPWTEKALADWLRNPRALRPVTTMPPVALTPEDWSELAEELGVPRS
jgi:mono/diheme cytochrome c family protein